MRLLTFEAFDQSDGKTLPDQQKDNEKDKYNDNDKYIWRTQFGSQFRPNFTISANFIISDKFYNPGIPGILGIPGVWAVSQFLRCFFSMALFFHILTYFDISIYAVKENQSGVSFFAKASLSIFAPRSVVSENHKKRPTGWQDIPRSMDRTMSIISTAWTCQHHISINISNRHQASA